MKILVVCLFIAFVMMVFPTSVRTPALPAVNQVEVVEQVEPVNTVEPQTVEPQEVVKVVTSKSLPRSFLIESVPFVPQAPFKIWDSLHEDACEEASLLTIKYWMEHKKPSNEQIENELQSFIDWQEDHAFGPSITLSDLKNAVTGFWTDAWWSEIKIGQDATLDDLRRELAAGNPIIIGAAGRELKNPHFKNGGPNYHMLVLIGYDNAGFITNDPGTQFGADYRYKTEIIDVAWHDWNEQDILLGARDYMVIK